MSQHSFRTPALVLQFSEKTISDKIQLFRVGTFYHPEYGSFEITSEILSEMKKNFDAKVRGIDLAVDYQHDNQDIAAAWFTGVELSSDNEALYGIVDWTPTGKKVVEDKEFRYISPEFTFEYKDNETLKDYGPTLLGAALTNRPVIKKMAPVVELSEVKYADGEQDKLKKDVQDRSQKYGIEVTSDAHLTFPAGQPTSEADYGDPVNYKFPLSDKGQIANARVRFKQFADKTYSKPESRNIIHERIVKAELAAGIVPSFDPKDVLDAALPEELKSKLQKPQGGKKMADQKPVPCAGDVPAPESDLSKMSPEQLMEMCKKLQADLAALQQEKESAMAEKKMAEKKASFTKLLSEGKACAAQEEAFLAGDMTKFIELAQPVRLSEGGTSGAPADDSALPIDDKIHKLAEEKVKSKTAKSLSEAYQMVLREKPELQKEKYGV